MLFDLEDFAYSGWIGYGAGRRYQNDERTIANSGDLEDYATTFRAVRDAHIKAINERFNNSIHLLPINKRSIAVQKYFAWMDSLRDFHIYNTRYPNGYTKFTGMLSSLRVLPVEGGVTFNEGDLLGIKDVSELTEEEISTLPDVRRLASDTGGPYKWKTVEDGWLVYVLFDQEWLDVYFAKFDAVVQAEKEMIIALEGLTENFAPYVAPVVVPSVKFKHGVSAGQTFDGTIKTTTGFVKFVIGKEEFILGSAGSTGSVNFTIPVSATSKKSGNFISCDASGVGSGDILEIEIDSSLSSINLSNAPELTRFVATNGTFGSLSLTKNTKLTYLDVRGNVSLKTLNISSLILLEELYCQGCSINSLDLTGMINLTRIEAANNKLSGIDLTGLTSLNYADFSINPFSGSYRSSILEKLDVNGLSNGTLIAPLEGRKSTSDIYYNSLISKDWTITSDGIPVPSTISFEGDNKPAYGSILSSTGYFKVIVPGGVEAIYGDGNVNLQNPADSYQPYFNTWDIMNRELFTGEIVSILSCLSDGTPSGDICGLWLSEAANLDLDFIDPLNMFYIQLEFFKGFKLDKIYDFPNLWNLSISNDLTVYDSPVLINNLDTFANLKYLTLATISNELVSINIESLADSQDLSRLQIMDVNLQRNSDTINFTGFNQNAEGISLSVENNYKNIIANGVHLNWFNIGGVNGNKIADIHTIDFSGSIIHTFYPNFINTVDGELNFISDSDTRVYTFGSNSTRFGSDIDLDLPFFEYVSNFYLTSPLSNDPDFSLNLNGKTLNNVYIYSGGTALKNIYANNVNILSLSINDVDGVSIHVNNSTISSQFTLSNNENNKAILLGVSLEMQNTLSLNQFHITHKVNSLDLTGSSFYTLNIFNGIYPNTINIEPVSQFFGIYVNNASGLVNLNLTNCTSLGYSSFAVDYNNDLENVTCVGCNFNAIQFHNNSKIVSVDFGHQTKTTLLSSSNSQSTTFDTFKFSGGASNMYLNVQSPYLKKMYVTNTGLVNTNSSSSISNSLNYCPSLEVLDLSGTLGINYWYHHNQLSSNIKELNLSNCNITNLAYTSGRLNKLEKLNLSNNKITNFAFLSAISPVLKNVDVSLNKPLAPFRWSILDGTNSCNTSNGTLIAPLEGINYSTYASYTALISRGWTITSDGQPVPTTPIVSDSNAQTLINQSEINDNVTANAINTLIVGMKTAGLWDLMTAVYLFVPGGYPLATRYNAKNTSQFALNFNGSITSDPNGSVKGNSSNGWIDTGIVPSQHLTFNDFHFSLYSNEAVETYDATDLGCSNGSSSSYLPIIGFSTRTQWNQTFFDAQSYQTNRIVASNYNAAGLWIGSVKNSTSSLYRGTRNSMVTMVSSNTQPNVSSLPSSQMVLLARNDGGTINNKSNRKISIATFGKGLTNGQASQLNTLIQNFQNAIGRISPDA